MHKTKSTITLADTEWTKDGFSEFQPPGKSLRLLLTNRRLKILMWVFVADDIDCVRFFRNYSLRF